MRIHIISIEALRAQANERPAGYVEDVMSQGMIDGDTLLLKDDVYTQLCNRYRTNSHAWPMWAKMAKFLARPGDKGIGDVIARTIGHENSAAFKVWFKATFNKDCGCSGRQAEWNRLYPLTPME